MESEKPEQIEEPSENETPAREKRERERELESERWRRSIVGKTRLYFIGDQRQKCVQYNNKIKKTKKKQK